MDLHMPVCNKPIPFPAHPEACDNCGNLLTKHDRAYSHAAKEALWTMMLMFGGIYSFYGDGQIIDDKSTKKLKEHLQTCAIDWDRTEEPRMGDIGVFDDTDSDPKLVHTLVGELYCRCHEYIWTKVIVPGWTFSELVWRTLNPDGKKGDRP